MCKDITYSSKNYTLTPTYICIIIFLVNDDLLNRHKNFIRVCRLMHRKDNVMKKAIKAIVGIALALSFAVIPSAIKSTDSCFKNTQKTENHRQKK